MDSNLIEIPPAGPIFPGESAALLSSIDDIIDEARQGRPFILTDTGEAGDRRGSLIIPAAFAGPDVINFMATHACGLVCLAITPDQAARLDLRPMSARDQGRGRNFTTSIEARTGVTTGISAFDRARTIAVALDPASTPADIVTPGHMFPLVAHRGGVLARAGHTEAAVDIARLAGLAPAGVICDILNEEGSPSGLSDLARFAARHRLRLGTLTDLIARRCRSESLVERIFVGPFASRHGGDFRAVVYRDRLSGAEHLALVRGDIRPGGETLVRVHRQDIVADLLSPGRQGRIDDALARIAAHPGPAVAVFPRPCEQPSLVARLRQGGPPPDENRDHGVGAQILKDLGVGRMWVMTDSQSWLAALGGFGLTVVGRIGLSLPTIAEYDQRSKTLTVGLGGDCRRAAHAALAKPTELAPASEGLEILPSARISRS